jgi:hypothetical protein
MLNIFEALKKIRKNNSPPEINFSKLPTSRLVQIAKTSASIMSETNNFQNSQEYQGARKNYGQASEVIDRRNGLYPDL